MKVAVIRKAHFNAAHRLRVDQWSEEKNIRWKIPLPGKGHSTPVVWGDHVFVTAAVPFGEKRETRYSGRPGAHDNLPASQQHKFLAIAIDRRNGKILW